MRREFELGPEDVRALEALGLPWETIRSSAVRWILIHEHPIPPGYNHATATVAIRIDTYPPGIIDMAFFHPALARADGKTINNLSQLTIDGRPFQQWSRHYAWRPGVDTLATHLRRVRGWLNHEFRKR
ncbi:E2/UBC family protein [Phenylobacterium sp.]|uniref:E2/UBC family protein n=1 Tax=Phenylobacterium sp. TaxID=1871053 RepID=UPI00391B8936